VRIVNATIANFREKPIRDMVAVGTVMTVQTETNIQNIVV
jgi:hypothetical protein